MIEPIYIELDWDYSLGTYNGELEIEIHGGVAVFTVIAENTRKLVPATYTHPEEAIYGEPTIAVMNLVFYNSKGVEESNPDRIDEITEEIFELIELI